MAKREEDNLEQEEALNWPKAFVVGCYLLMLGLACLATKSSTPLWGLALLVFMEDWV